MALKSTVFKVELSLSDMDRQYYADHSLVLARHPSETDERMMVRVLAFAMYACDRLEITRGLSTPEEPDLWRKDLTDDVELWIDAGLPDERRIRKACNLAEQVVVIAYGGRQADVWHEQNEAAFRRFDNLTVTNIPEEATRALEALVSRTMRLQCSIDGGHTWISTGDTTVEITPVFWKR